MTVITISPIDWTLTTDAPLNSLHTPPCLILICGVGLMVISSSFTVKTIERFNRS